ncbi:MAG: NADP-dependent isocitrate dehydrogenase [Magnetococcales bacterium]|nr:NADP-dependent isocitrate dehydrogenase [Magnetococcales bacterium]
MPTQTTQSPADIIFTAVDEAPQLASASLLPIVRAFTQVAGISIGTKTISLAGRILASFPENLTEAQRQPDDLAELAELVVKPEANVIKMPNISASVPQLKEAIAELQGHGLNVPNYPDSPKTDAEKEVRARYDKVKGSAVNPVLREGNSDRRAPKAVKDYAKKNPHSMGAWLPNSKTHVANMAGGDFYANEKSVTIGSASAGTGRIEFVGQDGTVTVLKEKLPLKLDEVIDGTFMSVKALRAFLDAQMDDAKKQDVLFSLHMKATMMKVSDPIIFGHAVVVYFKDVFEKHAKLFAEIGVDPNNGWADVLKKIQALPAEQRAAVEADIAACKAKRPDLYMVNTEQGVTNLHVPSDVIIDASMPAMIRAGGKGWGADGKMRDVKAVIPDGCYAGVYDATVEFCKKNGAFNPSTMGSVANVGLMAQKAEEYGSHNQTFKVPGNGTVRVVDAAGQTLFSHVVEEGDIWRLCQAKDAPIQDWVKLAVNRARLSGTPAVFWLDPKRSHDVELTKKVQRYLKDHDTSGLDIQILSPVEATLLSLQRMKEGLDTISVTGNVLRDYLTDLFPILEVGTSAKMLSIVPLMNGGGLFETGAGGSAPKHVEQFVQEGHLRWDSLGDFCALAASLEHLSQVRKNEKAAVLARALDQATGLLLENDKSPGRAAGELDNRGSHFYIALYWAQALAAQNDDLEMKKHFTPVAQQLQANEAKIVAELNALAGKAVDLGGHYHPDPAKVTAAMRSSQTLNAIVNAI